MTMNAKPFLMAPILAILIMGSARGADSVFTEGFRNLIWGMSHREVDSLLPNKGDTLCGGPFTIVPQFVNDELCSIDLEYGSGIGSLACFQAALKAKTGKKGSLAWFNGTCSQAWQWKTHESDVFYVLACDESGLNRRTTVSFQCRQLMKLKTKAEAQSASDKL
jgi:hypothetical protein